MIQVPRETAEICLIALQSFHWRKAQKGLCFISCQGPGELAELSAHMEILRTAIAAEHDPEACMGLTCSCMAGDVPDLDGLDSINLRNAKEQPPQHIFQGWCPTECRPDSLDPDCPACRTLMPRDRG